MFRRIEREPLVRGRIDHGRILLDRPVEQTDADDGAQDAADRIIHRRLRDAAVGERGLEMGHAHVRAGGHFEVVAKLHGVGLMHAAPVGHHFAVKAPVGFQNVLQQKRTGAGMVAVDEVVGTHDRPDLALLDGGLEGGQINFPQRAFADGRVHGVAVGLLVVAGKMLDARGNATALHSLDVGHRQPRRQKRVFAEILAVAPAQRRAVDVDRRPQQHPRAGAFVRGLLADGLPDLPDQIGVPRRGHQHAGRKRRGRPFRRGLAAAHTLAGVGHGHFRHAQPGNRLDGEAGAAEQRQLFIGRQPAGQILHAPLQRSRGVLIRRHVGGADQAGNEQAQTG